MDVKIQTKSQAAYHIWFMLRRFLTVLIIVLLQGREVFQITLMLFLTLFYLMYVLDSFPLQTYKENMIEITNELILFLSIYFCSAFLNPLMPVNTRIFMGYCLIAFAAIGIVFNLTFVANSSISSVKQYYNSWNTNKKHNQFFA